RLATGTRLGARGSHRRLRRRRRRRAHRASRRRSGGGAACPPATLRRRRSGSTLAAAGGGSGCRAPSRCRSTRAAGRGPACRSRSATALDGAEGGSPANDEDADGCEEAGAAPSASEERPSGKCGLSMSSWWRWMTLFVVVFALEGRVRARDDASRDAEANALWAEGRRLMAAGETVQACAKFETSLAIIPKLGTRLNLANCYEALGRIASAWSAFQVATEQ